MQIKIVCNNILLRKFKTIDIFELDLGFNLKGPVNMKPGHQGKNDSVGKMKIKDEFIVRYNSLYNRYASRYGHIGPITFYEDCSLPQMQMQIFREEDIFEVDFTEEDDDMPIRQYLSNLLEALCGDSEEKPENVNMSRNIIYTNMNNVGTMPDMTLPREQYIQAMIDMKKKQAEESVI